MSAAGRGPAGQHGSRVASVSGGVWFDAMWSLAALPLLAAIAWGPTS